MCLYIHTHTHIISAHLRGGGGLGGGLRRRLRGCGVNHDLLHHRGDGVARLVQLGRAGDAGAGGDGGGHGDSEGGGWGGCAWRGGTLGGGGGSFVVEHQAEGEAGGGLVGRVGHHGSSYLKGTHTRVWR